MESTKYIVVIEFNTAVCSGDRLSFDFRDEIEARDFLKWESMKWPVGMADIKLLKVTETELDRFDV